MSDMNDAPPPLPPDLQGTIRFLRILTGLLGGTMIVGLIAIVGLLVTRWPAQPRPLLPDGLTLPPGEAAAAVTMGRGWVAVVTEADDIVVFDATTGEILQTVPIRP